MNFKIIILFALLAFSAWKCSETSLSGGSSTETSLVSGMVYTTDGKTPATNVKVYIKPRNTPEISVGTSFPELVTGDSTFTNKDGIFSFDTSLDTGTYAIEVRDGEYAALINPVEIVTKNTQLILAPVTLSPTGSIAGRIVLTGGGSPESVYVLIEGVNRFTQVSSANTFHISSLAEGTYDIMVITTLEGYTPFDTTSIKVISADTTQLDPIVLRYRGIPMPKIALELDTLKKITIVSWSVDTPSQVQYYNVYRMKVDSSTLSTYQTAPLNINPVDFTTEEKTSFVKISSHPVTTTVFNDSIIDNFCMYVYRVTAVDSNGTEGRYGTSTSMWTESAFKLLRTIIPPEKTEWPVSISITADTAEIIRMYDYSERKVMNVMLDGRYVSKWDQIDLNEDVRAIITTDASGNTYICGASGDTNYSLLKFDPVGNILWRKDTSGTEISQLTVDEHGNSYCCYVNRLGESTIIRYSPQGQYLTTWDTNLYIGNLKAKNNKIYGIRRDSDLNANQLPNHLAVVVFDTNGTLIQKIPLIIKGTRKNPVIVDIVIDTAGGIYLLDCMNNAVRYYTTNGELIRQMQFGYCYGLFYNVYRGCISADGSLIVSFEVNGILGEPETELLPRSAVHIFK